MRDYQRDSKYKLPRNVYLRTLYLIRDYDRLKQQYQDILDESPSPPDGQPSGSELSDVTANKAIRLESISRELKAIEQAALRIPDEYRTGVLNNVKYRVPYPEMAGYATWARYRSKFIENVAKNMQFI